jgi:molybdopterin converting factor subunit 1
MTRVTVKLFAVLRERAKAGELEREFPDGVTVGEIWRRLNEEFPLLATARDAVSCAVNYEYVTTDFKPRNGDEVAFIPPVSGGIGGGEPWVGTVALGAEPIDVAELEREVASRAAGAVVTFVGATREENAGRRVLRLEYDAYEPMALREMRKIAVEAGRRFHIVRIAMRHRVGLVELGQVSVAIAVSAAHRAQAFEACRFAIDRVKEVAPIWKKEHFEGGEVWVGCQTSHPSHLSGPAGAQSAAAS